MRRHRHRRRALPRLPQLPRSVRARPRRRRRASRRPEATRKGQTMGCLVVLLAAAAPRVTLVLVWIFSNLVDRAFSGFLIPLLGLIVLPYTTLFYVLAWSPV